MEGMAQDRKFLGMLGSETVNKLTNKCDGVVGMSNLSMRNYMSKIMKELNSDTTKDEGSDGPSSSVTVSSSSSEAVNMRGSEIRPGGERGGKRKKRSLPDSIKRLYDKLPNNNEGPTLKKEEEEAGNLSTKKEMKKEEIGKDDNDL